MFTKFLKLGVNPKIGSTNISKTGKIENWFYESLQKIESPFFKIFGFGCPTGYKSE